MQLGLVYNGCQGPIWGISGPLGHYAQPSHCQAMPFSVPAASSGRDPENVLTRHANKILNPLLSFFEIAWAWPFFVSLSLHHLGQHHPLRVTGSGLDSTVRPCVAVVNVSVHSKVWSRSALREPTAGGFITHFHLHLNHSA